MIELRLVPHESSIVFNLNSFLGWATYNEHDQRAAISRTEIVQAFFAAMEVWHGWFLAWSCSFIGFCCTKYFGEVYFRGCPKYTGVPCRKVGKT